MKRVCAWCGKALGRKPGPDDLITHGICNRCLAEISTDPDRTMQSFLNGIPAPILMVNAEGTVVSANQMACQRLDKSPSQVRQRLGGEVMECAWARLPGGCAFHPRCPACFAPCATRRPELRRVGARRVACHLGDPAAD